MSSDNQNNPYNAPDLTGNIEPAVPNDGPEFYERWTNWHKDKKFEKLGAEDYAVAVDEKLYNFGEEAVREVYHLVDNNIERDLNRHETERILEEMNANISPHKIWDKIR